MSRRALVVMALAACGGRAPDKLVPWLEAYEATRACLVGTHGLGADLATATAIQELSLGDCRIDPKLRSITIPTDKSPTSTAWRAASRHVEKLSGDPRERGAAIDAIDAEVTVLRDAVRLPKLARARGTPIATVDVRPLLVDGKPLVETDASYLELWGGAVRGRTPTTQFVATALDRVVTAPRERAIALPGGTWSATDPRSLLYSIADGATRVVLVDNVATDGIAYLASVSTDDGVTWRDLPSPKGRTLKSATQNPTTGAVAVVVTAGGYTFVEDWAPGSPWWTAATATPPRVWPSATEHPTPRQGNDFGPTCFVGGTVWSIDGGLWAHRMTASSMALLDLPMVAIGDALDCGADAMVTVEEYPNQLIRCDATTCTAVHQALHHERGRAALLPDGSWFYAAIFDDVLGTWRPDGVSFYKLPMVGSVRAVVTFGGIPHVVISSGTTNELHFAPVPR